MDVFISWSGNRSKKLAEILSDWLPAVIQAVKPYFTPDDIAKGTKWNSEISKQLEVCRIGLICITPENYIAPWILFEAGALSKNLDKSRVCPILFDLEPTNVIGPLVQFQFTQFNKEDFRRLIVMINSELGDSKIADNTLNTVFDMWWPRLEEKVSEELAKHAKTNDKSIERTDRELLEELLTLVRTNSESDEEVILPDAFNDLAFRFANLVSKVSTLDEGHSLYSDLARMLAPIEYIATRSRRLTGSRNMVRQAEQELGKLRDGETIRNSLPGNAAPVKDSVDKKFPNE